MYKLVDGIQSDKIRDTLLRKGADLTLKKATDVCRADETTNQEMKIINKKLMWMLSKEIEEEAVMRTEEKYNTQLEQQHQQQRTSRRNGNTVEKNTCQSNVQNLVKHAENVEKRITGRIVAMQE